MIRKIKSPAFVRGFFIEDLILAHREIVYKNKPLTIHKARTEPHFNEKTILVTSTWDYIGLWLKRNHKTDADFYWQQAKHFYHATTELPKNSSPLTAYYCMLNATKAFLIAKGVNFSDQHGVSGRREQGRTCLSNEIVKFKGGGILAELCRHLGENANNEEYTLQDLLYNLPFIHRAFDLSYESIPELFIPIKNPRIVRSKRTDESWFCAELEHKYANMTTAKKLPQHFEKDTSITDQFIIRSTRRFNWTPTEKPESLLRYRRYHQSLRKDISYIYSPQRLWYIKRSLNNDSYIGRSTLTITFAAMHKLSELARYAPNILSKHFESRYNWLLSEFISIAPLQFIDELSSELTGYEFMPPGRQH
ncbi:YaaC family protein [Pseudomonas knackmussii]|uniref:YaaC family protein n=1 Tax=Pseudomonas knackmussii TaxID=65741 RepID=UPI0013644356|nr:YaaC family protein [Pseudomonas knackmussii]